MPRADPQGVGALDRLAKRQMYCWKNQGDELQKPQTSEEKNRLLSLAAPPRSFARCSLCPLLGPQFQQTSSIHARRGQCHSRRPKRLRRALAREPYRSALSRPENGCSRSEDKIPRWPCGRVSNLPKEYPDKFVPACEFLLFPRESVRRVTPFNQDRSARPGSEWSADRALSSLPSARARIHRDAGGRTTGGGTCPLRDDA